MSCPVEGCETESVNWLCLICGDYINYDDDLNMFTCFCGSYPPESCQFKCPNHDLEDCSEKSTEVS